ncbi:MAG: DUF488 domain-containing protein [Acidobacteriota bacterium]
MGSVRIFTIGHSTRSFEAFARLLQEQGIEQLLDVRSYPTSRKFPHFSQENLSRALEEMGVLYHHLKALGGFRKSHLQNSPNDGWESPGFRAYADYAMTEEFHTALDALVESSSEANSVLMCAEADPHRCHRQLICDAVVGLREIPVVHITEEGLIEHRMTAFARIEQGRLVYPKLQGRLPTGYSTD